MENPEVVGYEYVYCTLVLHWPRLDAISADGKSNSSTSSSLFHRTLVGIGFDVKTYIKSLIAQLDIDLSDSSSIASRQVTSSLVRQRLF